MHKKQGWNAKLQKKDGALRASFLSVNNWNRLGGIPDNLLQKMIDGKVNKFNEISLIPQKTNDPETNFAWEEFGKLADIKMIHYNESKGAYITCCGGESCWNLNSITFVKL